jgi:hypothetical protein
MIPLPKLLSRKLKYVRTFSLSQFPNAVSDAANINIKMQMKIHSNMKNTWKLGTKYENLMRAAISKRKHEIRLATLSTVRVHVVLNFSTSSSNGVFFSSFSSLGL